MKISLIIPVYNEEKIVNRCLEALIKQNSPSKNYEIVVINDGSTDKTLKSLKRKKIEANQRNLKFKIINLKTNQGRIIAREIGAKKAKYNHLLFVDSRCIANKNILKALAKINYQPIICNFAIDYRRSALDRFNHLFRKKLYSPYFGQKFKPIFITKSNFDEIPKGTGAFFCHKRLFLSCQLKDKEKGLSDDPKLLWNIVQKKKILKHPSIKFTYLARNSLKKTLFHTFERGPMFVDFYLNPKKKRFWLFILLPILTLTLSSILIFTNSVYFTYWLAFLLLIWIVISFWLSEKFKDFFISFVYFPLFAISFQSGIFKGLFLKLCGKTKSKQL